jgi:hypothetical protein
MNKLIAIAALSLMSHIAAAAPLAMPDSKPDPEQKGYENVIDCVRAAFKQAISQSDTFEEGGMIYKMDGKYFYTLPVTQGQYDSVHYTPWKPDRAAKVALYHTHPGHYHAVERFSPADIDFAKKVDMTMFVAVVKDNQIIVQRPEATFPLDPTAEPVINEQVAEMLKTDKPMDVAKKLMAAGVAWEAARMQVNGVLAAHAHDEEQKKLIAMLDK